MNRIIIHSIIGMIGGFFFGICFLSGLAFLTGSQVYYETTDSMRPVIEKGSLLIVKEKKEYNKGDIVAFYANYKGQTICVTHRIVNKLSDESYVMKGDANLQADRGTITSDNILGKVTGYIPYYGYVCCWVKEHSYLLLILLVYIGYHFFFEHKIPL